MTTTTSALPASVLDWTDAQLLVVWDRPQSWWIGREDLATRVACEIETRGLKADEEVG